MSSVTLQPGQSFGPGTIVNPSNVTAEHLKDAKLVTVLVPNHLETVDTLDFERKEPIQLRADRMPSFNFGDPAMLAIDLIGGAALGGIVGTVIGTAVQSTPVGVAVGVGVGILGFTLGRAVGGI